MILENFISSNNKAKMIDKLATTKACTAIENWYIEYFHKFSCKNNMKSPE